MKPPPIGWTIRPAHPDDAAGIIALITATVAEPINNLLSESDEFALTEEQEREFLAAQGMRLNWAAFVAIADTSDASSTSDKAQTRVIGLVTADGEQRRAIRHRASIGLSVTHDWRRHGVGQALMERAIDWARESGVITRLELEVLTRNDAAIHLYERLGFEREGVIRRALLRQGEYLDEYSMSLLLEQAT
jgi:L-phenylalanine/L-methionine N-acetyltransferase